MENKKIKLIVLGGPMDGMEFDADKPQMTIGRRDDQDICLPLDPAVSRRHARLTVKDQVYWLEDVGSSLGTFVEGGKDKFEGRVKISPGNTFRLGPLTTLKLIAEDLERKVIQRADRLMRQLTKHLPQVPEEKCVALKEQLIDIVRKFDQVTCEEELLTLLREMTAVIEQTLGIQILLTPLQQNSQSPESKGFRTGEIPEPSTDHGDLEGLKSFFKSNLSEIIERMESGELGEAKP